METSYIKNKIKEYAKRQIISWETIQTLIMTAIMLFCVVEIISYGSVSTIGAIFTALVSAAAIFGLYELIPSIVMIFDPYSAKIFSKGTDRAEKKRICDYIDDAVASGDASELSSMLATRDYAVLMGKRYLNIIKWIDIEEVNKQEYPNRHNRRQELYFINFMERNGSKRVLDIKGSREDRPMKRLAEVISYIKNEHPGIELMLTNKDVEEINNEIYNSRE